MNEFNEFIVILMMLTFLVGVLFIVKRIYDQEKKDREKEEAKKKLYIP